jgi:hypothetical protein
VQLGQPDVPFLPVEATAQEDVVNRLNNLIAHDAGAARLQPMAEPPLRCPI